MRDGRELGWCFSSLLGVPGEPFSARGCSQQVPQLWLCCHHFIPWEHLQCCILAVAGGAFCLPSLAPTRPLPLQEPRQTCHRHWLGIGADPVAPSLGCGCPSQRQLLLMDGFRGSPVPCSQFAVFSPKVFINPVIAAALHSFLFSGGTSIHPRLALRDRLCPSPSDSCAACFSRSSLPAGTSNP